MTFVVNTFAVTDDQYLGGFMFYQESFGYFVGDGAVTDQVQVVEVNRSGKWHSFQPALHQLTGGTAGAMFEYYLGAIGRFFADIVQLRFCLKVYPTHV